MRWAIVSSALAGALLVALAAGGRARACSCLEQGPRFPRVHGPLPADARGLVLGGHRWSEKTTKKDVHWDPVPSPEHLLVQRVDGGRAEWLPSRITPFPEPAIWHPLDVQTVGLLVTTERPLVPGGVYRFFTGEEIPGLGFVSTEVTLSDEPLSAARVPLIVGPLVVAPVTVAAGVSCTADVVAAHRTLRMELPPSASRFAPDLVYTTRVDGKPWRPSRSFCAPTTPGSSWIAPGEELVFAACEATPFGDEGTGVARSVAHTVQMRATAPGGEVAIETPVEVVFLPCPGPVGVELPPVKVADEPSRWPACHAAPGAPPSGLSVIAPLLAVTRRLRRRSRRVLGRPLSRFSASFPRAADGPGSVGPPR
jgi:hypothetical protein